MHIVQGSNKKNTATKYMCFFWFSQILVILFKELAEY